MVVGTKTDCRNDEAILRKLAEENVKPVTAEEGEKLAKDIKAVCYMECSALTRKGLKEVFEEAVRIVLENKKEEQTTKKPETKKKCCLL